MLTHRVGRPLIALAALAMAGGLAACTAAGASETRSHHLLDVTAADYSYQMPTMTPLNAGLETVRLHNAGTQPHQATIMRLHDGVTYDQFAAALRQGEGPALALIDFEGGVNTIAPGATASAYSNLTSGNYALLCFVQGADGVPHLAKGMVMPFQVNGPNLPPRAPETSGSVGLHSYGFDLPAGFGQGTYKVINNADEAHELAILKVAPGKTAQDVMAFLTAGTPPSGPPPFADAGGVGALSPGVTAFGVFHLQPGSYVALCFVPDDQAPHLPHFMMGMFQPFTVS